MQNDITTLDAELAMQEMESAEAPDFWGGVSIGVAISTGVVASLGSVVVVSLT